MAEKFILYKQAISVQGMWHRDKIMVEDWMEYYAQQLSHELWYG